MNEKDLKNLFKELKQTRPDTEWSASARQNLINHIDNSVENLKSNPSSLSKSEGWFERTLAQPRWAGAFTLGIFAIMIMTSALAQNSLPGDSLYNVKVASEHLRGAMTFDEYKDTALRAEYAERRVDEAYRLTMMELQDDTSDEDMQDLQQYFANYKEEIAEAKTSGDTEALEQKVAEVTEKAQRDREILTATQKTNIEPDSEGGVEATVNENTQKLLAGCTDEELIIQIGDLLGEGTVPSRLNALELARACAAEVADGSDVEEELEEEAVEETETNKEAGEYETGESE